MFRAIRRIFRLPVEHKLLSILILLFLMLIMRLVWGWSVHRQLQSQLATIRSRGEPIELSEVTHQLVPSHENAALLHRQAVIALVPGVDSPRNSNLQYPDFYPTPSSRWIELAAASEKAHAKAFALVRAARQRSRSQFATSMADEAELRYLGDLRTLANVINDGAEYSHLRGDDTEAVERLLDALHISHALAADDYFISYAVAIGIDGSTCHSIHLIGRDLSAPAAKIGALIDQLLDDEFHRAAFKRVLTNERVREIRWSSKSAQRHWLLSPLADRDITRELPNLEILLEAADCSNFQQAESILQRCNWDQPPQSSRFVIFPDYTKVPRYSRWFYNGIDFSPWIERHYRMVAERRLTAVSLACQLYRVDHKQFPQTLAELVPKYLPAIPGDPFFSDGRPIGYAIKTHAAPLSGPRPVLYFDPGGGDIVLRAEPIYDWYTIPRSGAPVRQYRDLTRFAPASQKAVNNNPYQSNAPGEDSQKNEGFQQP